MLASVVMALSLATAILVSPLSIRARTTGAAVSCKVSSMLVNSCRPWLGAAVSNYPQVANDEKSQTLYHEQRIGRKLDIVRTYYPVGENELTPYDVYFATRPNTILDVNWNPTLKWGDIASQNAGINEMAAGIKALGSHKIFLSLWHEPENNVSPGGDPSCPGVHFKGTSGTVAQYVNMWSYVESRFARDGVTNVVWAMDYMNYPAWQCLVNGLYPGDKLINWILFNGYGDGTTPNFDADVGRFYSFLTKNSNASHDYLSKPWGISEWGIEGYSVAEEESYDSEAKRALDDNTFPRLKAYIEFDAVSPVNRESFRVAYTDSGTYDPAKGHYYYAFADDPRFTDSYHAS
jgi:hypothetical protein